MQITHIRNFNALCIRIVCANEFLPFKSKLIRDLKFNLMFSLKLVGLLEMENIYLSFNICLLI